MTDESTSPEVPDFDLIRPIGEGGFGQVWRARNRTTGHLRAVKVIPLGRSGRTDPAGREITSLTRLEANLRAKHPHLLDIHHVGKTATDLFYVMDPADDVSGQAASSEATYEPATLQHRLAAGPLSAEECLRCARGLLEGLACLHAAGMVHRDVKPGNCLFIDGQLKLADFGLLTGANPLVSRLGTQKYMPPDGQMDTRADVYAAGLVIYETLTGLPADSFPRLGQRTGPITRHPTLRMLNRLALHACQPDPKQRFPDARRMLAEMTVLGKRVAQDRPRRGRPLLVAGACLVLLAFALRGRLWMQPELVEVNFITTPYEAVIYLDKEPLIDPGNGRPWRTPCTVTNVPAGVHHLLFRHDVAGDHDVGEIDFATEREVVAEWGSPPE